MKKISAKHAMFAGHGSAPRLTITTTVLASLFGINSAFAEPLFQQSIMPKPDNTRWTDNYVEVGVGSMKTDSPNDKAYKFGEFTGLTNGETFGILGLNWIFQNQKDDSLNFRIHGHDLALDTQKLSMEGGRQGAWMASFSADRLVRAELSPAKFIYAPASLGSSYLKNLQPRPDTGANATATGASLDAFFNTPANYTNFDIEQERDIYKLGVSGVLSPNWTASVNYREDVRGGNRLTGLYFNTSTPATGVSASAGRQAVIVPYAIDDKTQSLDATLGYTTKALQGQLTYSYSRYENQLDRFNIDNPNQMATGLPVGSQAASTLPVGQMSLSPDNEYHQITATAAYNFSKDTRAKAQLSYGIATQDESFLPYNSAGTRTATVGGVANTALPASLDGKVINSVADLTLMTKPLDEMSFKMGYQYRDVNDKTPRIWVNYYGRDGLTTAGNGSSERRNGPVSSTEQRVYVDSDYALGERTQVRALLEHSMLDYTLFDVTETKTNKVQLDLRRTFSDEFLGSVGYIFSQRTGTQYDKNAYFRETYTSAFVGTGATQTRLTNHPSMRPFMLNDYDENRVRALGNWTVSETVAVGASIDGYDRKYKGNDCNRSFAPTNFDLPDTCLGTRKSLGGYANADLNWQPDEDLLLFTFLSVGHSETEINQRDWQTTDVDPGAANNQQPTEATLSNLVRNWTGTMTYTDQTAGIGAKWQLTPKLELGGQYVYSLGNGATEFTSAFSNPQSMPDTESTLHTVDLYAKWAYSSKLVFRINYVFENLKITDWSYDPFSSTTSTNQILLTGQASPKYENHVIGLSLALSTW